MFRIQNAVARRIILISIIILVAAASVVGSWQNALNTDHAIRDQLKNRSASIAALLDQDDIRSLTGNSIDEHAYYYQDTKQTLAKLKELNPDVRSLYVTMKRGDKLYFYVDSEHPDSDYYSPPGEYYPDATPLFKGLFDSGQTAVEGPAKDEFGTWVSGLAPIHDNTNGEIIGVLGIDIDAANYYQSVFQSAFIPMLLGFIALAVIGTNIVVRIRQEKQFKIQSELVSIASHDLRSPLAGVRWATESLIPQLDDKNKIMAGRILVSATNLQSSIDDLLQITRVGSPRAPKLELKNHDLTDLVREVCDSQNLAAAQKNVAIEIDQTWNKSIMVRCDAERLKRALLNVVSNAVKYTRSDTEIFINYHFNGNTHQIRVSDQGIGIPDDEKSKIFRGFYRASNAKASEAQGTGMGMYLTRLIIEQHGGKVSLDSKQDVGTTVTITIPS